MVAYIYHGKCKTSNFRLNLHRKHYIKTFYVSVPLSIPNIENLTSNMSKLWHLQKGHTHTLLDYHTKEHLLKNIKIMLMYMEFEVMYIVYIKTFQPILICTLLEGLIFIFDVRFSMYS